MYVRSYEAGDYVCGVEVLALDVAVECRGEGKVNLKIEEDDETDLK